MMNNRPKTLILDIDGTLVDYDGNPCTQTNKELTLLPGVLDKFKEWDRKCYNIVLLTGRRESERKATEEQLKKLGIFYDTLVMGVGPGQRVLINDLKPNSEEPTAVAINVKRNQGLENIDV